MSATATSRTTGLREYQFLLRSIRKLSSNSMMILRAELGFIAASTASNLNDLRCTDRRQHASRPLEEIAANVLPTSRLSRPSTRRWLILLFRDSQTPGSSSINSSNEKWRKLATSVFNARGLPPNQETTSVTSSAGISDCLPASESISPRTRAPSLLLRPPIVRTVTRSKSSLTARELRRRTRPRCRETRRLLKNVSKSERRLPSGSRQF